MPAASSFPSVPLATKPIKLLLAGTGCFLSVLLGGMVAGCGGGTTSTPPVTPMSATIDPSLNGMKTGVLPIVVKIQLGGGATAKNVAITVGGVDVSTSFATNSDGNLEAQLSSTQVYVGSNRVMASIVGASGSDSAAPSKATFTYDPTLAPGAQSVSFPASLPDVVPILTRVLYNSSTFGVQVGNTAYPGSGAITSGFQVIQLNRSTLNLVSNQSYSMQSDTDVLNFAAAISPSSNNIASCGYGGCLTIIQSLSDPGYNPCFSGGFTCSIYTTAFTSIGGTSTIGYVPPSSDIGYSFIGNIGQDTLHAGSQDERITCSSTNCGSFPVPDDATVSQGIAPNGQQYDVMPNLNQTGSTTCPTTTATAAMPQVTYCSNGSISGALVLAGTQAYTFASTDPPVRYNMTVAPEDPNKSLLTLGATGAFPGLALESAELPANADGSPVGGFHLVVLDATTLQDYGNNTYTVNNKSCPPVSNGNYCIGPDGTNIYELDQLYQDIRSSNSRKYLFFLHSIGNLNHNYGAYGSNANTSYWAQDIWDRDAQAVLDLGGTWVTFDSLNNYAFTQDPYDQYSNQTVPADDYNMIGQWWINASGVPNPYAAEESSQISRQTINSPTPPVSNMYGVLSKERDGYYRATSHSLSPNLNGQQALDFASAALQPSTPWPISTSSTGGTLAAYTWISNQLLGCITGCGDIHNAYANLNISPSSWQGLLAQLKPTTDGGDNFSPSDFETVRGQLSLEFQYLSALRTYQANLQNLLQSEQANLSIILQQVVDDIGGTIPVTTRNPGSSFGIENWRSDVTDGLNIVGALSALVPVEGAQTGTSIIVSLTNFAIDASAKHTVDAKGRTLEELTHTLYAASEIAQQKIQQYSQILATNGNDFTRITNDWGRLQKVGIPLISNQIVWSGNASATLLNAFDTATARGLYKSIMPAAFQINQYRWASPGLHNTSGLQPQMYNDTGGECKYYEFLDYMIENGSDPTALNTYYSFALWPGAPIDGLGVSIQDAKNTETFNTWWDVWTINWQYAGDSIDCPSGTTQPMRSFFTSSGILEPLDPTDPSRLGIYKPWLFERSGFPIYQQNDPQFASNFWNGDGEQNPPIEWGGGPLAPDPVNY